MLSLEDRDFIKTYAPKIGLIGGRGSEVTWRPGGFEDSIRALQIYEKLGYPGWGFTEQTQSWIFQSIWPLCEPSIDAPDYEAFYDTFVLAGAAAMRTEKLRMSLVTDPYRRAPSVLAQTLLTLDQASKGRIHIMIGAGEDKQFLPHGLERTKPRYERVEECIRVVKALLRTTKPLTLEGKFWPQKDALLAAPLYNPDKPPMVGMVGGGPTAMKVAGRVADCLGTYSPGAYGNDLGAFEQDLATMRAEAERVGRDPKSIPVTAGPISILCENDDQVARAYASPFTRSTVLNLTPTASHWKKWGSEHPLGDEYCLSGPHRATLFPDKDDLLKVLAKVKDHDIDQMLFIGTPEDVAKRAVPWLRVAGVKEFPLGGSLNMGNAIFLEQRELAEDGLPRWHHLQLRLRDELNRLLQS